MKTIRLPVCNPIEGSPVLDNNAFESLRPSPSCDAALARQRITLQDWHVLILSWATGFLLEQDPAQDGMPRQFAHHATPNLLQSFYIDLPCPTCIVSVGIWEELCDALS